MKIAKIAVPVLLFALVATGAKSQTFKTDYSTKLILAGNGNDPVNTLTLASSARTDSTILMFPNPAVATSYVLSSDASGHLTWSTNAGSLILGGDAIGPAGANIVRGASGPSFSVSGYEDVAGGQNVSGNDTVGGNASVAGYQTITGGQQIGGNDTVLGILYANGNSNIDNTPSTGGTVNIGNNTLGDSSTTTINGIVNFTGAVNIPAGDLNLGLANDEFYIGSTGGVATPQTITQDVAITNGGVATVNSASGPKFSVSGYEDVAGGQNVSGNDTVGGNASVAGYQTITGGQQIGGNDTVLGILYANGNSNIDNTPSTGGTVNIGNNTLGDSSTTTINGIVNFTGAVNIPAGDLNLGLANDKFYIGSTGGVATPQAITQDVAITNGGVATVNSASGPSFSVSGYEDVAGGQNVSGNDTVGGNASVAGYQTITGGQQIGGNDTVLGILYANGNSNIDNTPSTGGTVNIGNNTLGDSSTTTINGIVNFTGAVNIPAGDLNLGLANDKFYIGSTGGVATPQAITQDVAITNGGVATVNSASGPKFSVSGYEDVAGGQNVSGNDTVGGNASVAGYQTITGGQQIGGNDTVLGILYANGNSNIDNTPSTGGTVNIGNNTLGDSSTTTINGIVNFTGAVNIPAGDLNLGLANDKFYIGSTGGVATPQAITQDVAITNGGVATVNSASGPKFSVSGYEDVAGGQNVSGNDTVGGNASVAGYQTITGGQQIGGNDTVLGILYANGNSNIDNTPSTGGTVNIGNNTLGDSSTTTINGIVNFTGAVNIPAGDLNLGLANDKFYIGSTGGVATPQAITQDVAITNGGVATVNSANATTFAVVHAETVGSTLNVTGQTTLGSTALSASSTVTAADPLVLTAGHSYFPLSGSATVNSITGANTAAGQIIVLVNTNPPPTAAGNYITLHSNGTLVLNGSDVIIGAGGSATLISDGTNWHLMSAE